MILIYSDGAYFHISLVLADSTKDIMAFCSGAEAVRFLELEPLKYGFSFVYYFR